MAFSFGIDASKALEGLKRIKAGGGKIRAPIVEALRVTANDIARDARASIRKRSGGGRSYPRGAGSYRASAPGEPPVQFTGTLLARGIHVKLRARDLVARVLARAPHAHLLESGTKLRIVKKTGRSSGRMEARPFLRPAEKRHGEKLIARLRIGIERAAAQI